MKALAALILEFGIAYYERAEKEMGLLHPDLPEVVRKLHKLRAQRPPVEQRVRSRCEEVWGMCGGDPQCRKTNCPGRWGIRRA